MTDLRKEARGRDCQVRIVGVCNLNPETTVLAHVRLAGVTGVGMKASDILGSWCCSSCHDAIDGRTKVEGMHHPMLQLALYCGVIRTQAILIKEGKIKS